MTKMVEEQVEAEVVQKHYEVDVHVDASSDFYLTVDVVAPSVWEAMEQVKKAMNSHARLQPRMSPANRQKYGLRDVWTNGIVEFDPMSGREIDGWTPIEQ